MVNKNEKKAVETAEVKTEENKQPQKHGWGKLLAVLVVAGAGWSVYQNPQVIDQVGNLLESVTKKNTNPEIYAPVDSRASDLQDQISALREEIYALKNVPAEVEQVPLDAQKLNELYDKFDNIEKTNMNIINSKADAAAVLGLMARLDELEEKVKLVSRATDESALILTGAMLVKEAADRGGNFVYEAEVLGQLAQNKPQLEPSLQVIDQLAKTGIATNTQLINEIESIYKAILVKQKETEAKTWKDRVMSKMNEFVKVRKVNQAEQAEQEALLHLKNAKDMTQNANFAGALKEVEASGDIEVLQDADLRKWQEKAQSKVKFDEAVSKISTYSLAVMKVNAIKKEIKE